MKLNFDSIYRRTDNILYCDDIPIYKFKQNFPDYEVLSEQGVKYMEDYINANPKLCEVIPGWIVADDISQEQVSQGEIDYDKIKFQGVVTIEKTKIIDMIIDLNNTIHAFEKQNLVTISAKGAVGSHDVLKCKICGLKAKTTQLGKAKFDSGQSASKMINCGFDMKKVVFVGRQIEVINCVAQGSSFGNLIPKSTHTVIEPPKPYINDMSGVWVQGVGEPVKLLSDEFKFLEELPKETAVEEKKEKAAKPVKDLSELKATVLTGDESHNPNVSRLEQVRFYVDKGITTTATIAQLIDANPSYVYRLVKQVLDENSKD